MIGNKVTIVTLNLNLSGETFYTTRTAVKMSLKSHFRAQTTNENVVTLTVSCYQRSNIRISLEMQTHILTSIKQ